MHLKALGFDNDEIRHRVVAYCPQVGRDWECAMHGAVCYLPVYRHAVRSPCSWCQTKTMVSDQDHEQPIAQVSSRHMGLLLPMSHLDYGGADVASHVASCVPVAVLSAFAPQVLAMSTRDIDVLIRLWDKFKFGVDEQASC